MFDLDKHRMTAQVRGVEAHYDLFISCSGPDMELAQRLVKDLHAEGVIAWLDIPAQDMPLQQRRTRLIEVLGRTSSCALLFTSARLGPRQGTEELAVANRAQGDPSFRVITVVYPGAGPVSELSRPFSTGLKLVAQKARGEKEIARKLAVFSSGADPEENVGLDTGATELKLGHENRAMDHDVTRQPEFPKGVTEVERSRFSWLRRVPARRIRIAAAGYATVAVFGIAFGAANVVGASTTGALVVGALVAAPLALAFISDRITGIKAFSVEISLSEVTVPTEEEFSGNVMFWATSSLRASQLGGSGIPALIADVQSLIRARSRLLRVNLLNDKYWWSTRIFLVAALAADYTEVDALIFVRSGDEQIFVGIAAPRAVRARLAVKFPDYEAAYRKIRSKLNLSTDEQSQVNAILLLWEDDMPDEARAKQVVGSADLKEWLSQDLDTQDLPTGPLPPSFRLDPSLRYQINSHDHRYVALTDKSRLADVVDRDELAMRTTEATLRTR